MTIYADALDLQDIISGYGTYVDAGAVNAAQTMNYPEVVKANNDVILRGASEQYMDIALTELLKQPVMAGVYDKNGIKPEDVPAYIESVHNMPFSHKKTMLTSLVGAYGQAAFSKNEENQPIVAGAQEFISLTTHVNKVVDGSMKRFLEAQKPVAKKLNLWQRIQRKFGFDKELDSGTNEAAQPTKGATRIVKLTAAKEETKAQKPSKGVKHFELKRNVKEEYGDR